VSVAIDVDRSFIPGGRIGACAIPSHLAYGVFVIQILSLARKRVTSSLGSPPPTGILSSRRFSSFCVVCQQMGHGRGTTNARPTR